MRVTQVRKGSAVSNHGSSCPAMGATWFSKSQTAGGKRRWEGRADTLGQSPCWSLRFRSQAVLSIMKNYVPLKSNSGCAAGPWQTWKAWPRDSKQTWGWNCPMRAGFCQSPLGTGLGGATVRSRVPITRTRHAQSRGHEQTGHPPLSSAHSLSWWRKMGGWKQKQKSRLSLQLGQPERRYRDFPGGPGVRTPSSQSRGPGFDPWSGN